MAAGVVSIAMRMMVTVARTIRPGAMVTHMAGLLMATTIDSETMERITIIVAGMEVGIAATAGKAVDSSTVSTTIMIRLSR